MAILNTTPQSYYDNESSHGNYQFVALNDIIDQFLMAYVGEEKIITKAKRIDVAFHAQRALAEYSFDTFKSFKNTEFKIPNSLKMVMPQDYVNYTKISWIDSSGIKHRIYPTRLTSDPENPFQNADGEYKLEATSTLNALASTITLDSEYLNIQVGMLITGPYIPSGTYVDATSNAAGITTVSIVDSAGVAAFPTFSGSEIVLQFTNVDGKLINSEDSSYVIELLTWNVTDYKITASTTTDFDNIEVGMLISHNLWPQGTTVTNVDKVNGVIIVDQLPSAPQVAATGEITFISPNSTSLTWSNYRSTTPAENSKDDYEDDTYWPLIGERYGIEPEHAQINGSFYINEQSGKIYFSSNLAGKTIVLDYISDGLGTEEEMRVHKFAEDAMYKTIAHSIMAYRVATPEFIIQRLRQDKIAAARKAKLRLSNIKLEELAQILRGKSKQIKH